MPTGVLRALGTRFYWKYFAKHFRMLLQLLVCPAYRRFLRYRVAAAIEHSAILEKLCAATVIDVGANRGQFSIVARHRFPQASILAFEPIQEARRQMEQLFAKDPLFESFPFALGAEEALGRLRMSCHEPCSSLLPMAPAQMQVFPGTQQISLRMVPIRRLDQVLGGRNLARPILCKVDVQGTEESVLDGFGQLIADMDFIIVEVSLVEFYFGQTRFSDLYGFLAGWGFLLETMYGAFTDRMGAILQCNALFRRERISVA